MCVIGWMRICSVYHRMIFLQLQSKALKLLNLFRHIAHKQILSISSNPGQTLKTFAEKRTTLTKFEICHSNKSSTVKKFIYAFQFLLDHSLQSWVILLWSTNTEHFLLKFVKGQLQSYIFHVRLCHCCNTMPHVFHQL